MEGPPSKTEDTEAEYCVIIERSNAVLFVALEFGGGTRLAMPKMICAPDTSSLKPGSGVTKGVLD